MLEGDPSKQPSNLSMLSFPGEPPSGTSSVSGGKALSSSSHQAITHPPFPPPSGLGVEERTLWFSGKETIEGLGIVQLVEDLSDDEGHGRGRSRKKRRCTASEEYSDQGLKWQRLE